MYKIMIDNKKDKITDFDWDAFFNEVGQEEVKVEDDFIHIVEKYSKKPGVKEVENIKPVSDEKFYEVVYRKQLIDLKQEEKKESIIKEVVEEELIEEIKEESKIKKEPLLKIFLQRFILSSMFSIIIIYVLYTLIFN